MLEHELREQGITAPTSVIDGLLDRRLLAEVPHEGAAAIEFARSHCAVPTMYGPGKLARGTGAVRDRPARLRGAPGDPAGVRLWAWSAVDGDLCLAGWSAAAGGRRRARAGNSSGQSCGWPRS